MASWHILYESLQIFMERPWSSENIWTSSAIQYILLLHRESWNMSGGYSKEIRWTITDITFIQAYCPRSIYRESEKPRGFVLRPAWENTNAFS